MAVFGVLGVEVSLCSCSLLVCWSSDLCLPSRRVLKRPPNFFFSVRPLFGCSSNSPLLTLLACDDNRTRLVVVCFAGCSWSAAFRSLVLVQQLLQLVHRTARLLRRSLHSLCRFIRLLRLYNHHCHLLLAYRLALLAGLCGSAGCGECG